MAVTNAATTATSKRRNLERARRATQVARARGGGYAYAPRLIVMAGTETFIKKNKKENGAGKNGAGTVVAGAALDNSFKIR